jgi:hypothetical protein
MGVEENMERDPSELPLLMRYHVHHEFIQTTAIAAYLSFLILVESGPGTESIL